MVIIEAKIETHFDEYLKLRLLTTKEGFICQPGFDGYLLEIGKGNRGIHAVYLTKEQTDLLIQKLLDIRREWPKTYSEK